MNRFETPFNHFATPPPAPSHTLRLTDEQEAIIHTNYNLLINACAGSGKTSTLIAYALQKQVEAIAAGKTTRGLYLAYNRSVRLEAQDRFARSGVHTIDVHTAHSLAYAHIMKGSRYKTGNNPAPYELVAQLELTRYTRYDRMEATILARHILSALTWFCNHNEPLAALDYPSLINPADRPMMKFVRKYHEPIMQLTQVLWEQMVAGERTITHDGYLKLFALSCPKLRYDYILFDEGQDASPVMLQTMLAQTTRLKSTTKLVVVGDRHQQIYGFRHAVNALENLSAEGGGNGTDFPTLGLTQSFRFGQPIADLATRILSVKRAYNPTQRITPIRGTPQGTPGFPGLSAVIGRTNFSVIGTAIKDLCIEQIIGSVYFEGHLDTYTFMDQGAPLTELLALHRGRLNEVRNAHLQSFRGIDELKDYIDATGDKQLAMAMELVETYQDELPHLIGQVRAAHMPLEGRASADQIYSTLHRAKGLEYAHLRINPDFVTWGQVDQTMQRVRECRELSESDQPVGAKRQAEVNQKTRLLIAETDEEINMLYVAVTRARHVLDADEVIRNLVGTEAIPSTGEKTACDQWWVL